MLLQREIIPGTARTPEVILSAEGKITIKGRWMMESASDFSNALSDWFDTYIFDAPDITAINIHLEYFNGRNSNLLISLLRKILFIKLLNKGLIINWFYDEGDEDILDLGEYISAVLGAPFNFIMAPEPRLVCEYNREQV